MVNNFWGWSVTPFRIWCKLRSLYQEKGTQDSREFQTSWNSSTDLLDIHISLLKNSYFGENNKYADSISKPWNGPHEKGFFTHLSGMHKGSHDHRQGGGPLHLPYGSPVPSRCQITLDFKPLWVFPALSGFKTRGQYFSRVLNRSLCFKTKRKHSWEIWLHRISTHFLPISNALFSWKV